MLIVFNHDATVYYDPGFTQLNGLASLIKFFYQIFILIFENKCQVIYNQDKHSRLKTSNIFFGKTAFLKRLGFMVQFLFPAES